MNLVALGNVSVGYRSIDVVDARIRIRVNIIVDLS